MNFEICNLLGDANNFTFVLLLCFPAFLHDIRHGRRPIVASCMR